jgi:hypothetical protein
LYLLTTSRFQVFRQGIELQLPERAVLLDPRSRILHGLRSQSATVNASIDFALEQAGGLQDTHVLRDGGQRNAERLREFCDHGLASCEASQNRPAGGIGERAERGIQCRRQIVNHMV